MRVPPNLVLITRKERISVEIPFKEQITALLNHPAVSSLMNDGTYKVNENTTLYLDGDLNFSLSFEDQTLSINCNDVRPKITYSPFARMKKLAKVDGRLRKIKITENNVTLEIDGLPDQVVTLT